jgi:hypothetical protein
MTLQKRLFLFAALSTVGTGALASGFDAGAYHDAKCSRCHDTTVYTREDRKMTSYPRLASKVRGCNKRFGEELTTENFFAFVDHLNDNFYQFSK